MVLVLRGNDCFVILLLYWSCALVVVWYGFGCVNLSVVLIQYGCELLLLAVFKLAKCNVLM